MKKGKKKESNQTEFSQEGLSLLFPAEVSATEKMA